jgi:hypothetical protein
MTEHIRNWSWISQLNIKDIKNQFWHYSSHNINIMLKSAQDQITFQLVPYLKCILNLNNAIMLRISSPQLKFVRHLFWLINEASSGDLNVYQSNRSAITRTILGVAIITFVSIGACISKKINGTIYD